MSPLEVLQNRTSLESSKDAIAPLMSFWLNIPKDETGYCVYVRVSDQLNMPSLGLGMIIGQNYTEPYFQSNLLSLVAMI